MARLAPALPILVAMDRSRVRWPPVLSKEAELFCSHQLKHILELCICILLKSGIIRKFFFCFLQRMKEQSMQAWQINMHTKSACLGTLQIQTGFLDWCCWALWDGITLTGQHDRLSSFPLQSHSSSRSFPHDCIRSWGYILRILKVKSTKK